MDHLLSREIFGEKLKSRTAFHLFDLRWIRCSIPESRIYFGSGKTKNFLTPVSLENVYALRVRFMGRSFFYKQERLDALCDWSFFVTMIFRIMNLEL